MQQQPTLALDRPADRSLAAFKAFVNAMASQLGFEPGEADDMTDDEWTAFWQEYWADGLKSQEDQ
jgi:hypothetical protein